MGNNRGLNLNLLEMIKKIINNHVQIPIHVEIWVASRLLAEEKNIFSKKELIELIENLFNDFRHGISTHISSCCVANKHSNHPKNYNYLIWVSKGNYKIIREGDYTHPDKIGCQIHPRIEDIPHQFRYLLDKNFDKVTIISEAPKPQTQPYTPRFQIKDETIEEIDLDTLKDYEREAIDRTILMMAYNPSCARIFSKEANKEIKKRIFSIIDLLPEIKTQDEFNMIHRVILDKIVDDVRNYRDNNPSGRISYGQAQKGLNVFLKVYVDWARLPSLEISNIIVQFLHCPLDSVVMKTIKKRESNIYLEFGSLPCDLKHISTYEQYISWQKLIDKILEKEEIGLKRTLIDVIWYLESLKKKD